MAAVGGRCYGRVKLLLVVVIAMLVGGAAGGFAVKTTLDKKHEAQAKDAAKNEKERQYEQPHEASCAEAHASRTNKSCSQIVNLGEFLLNVASPETLHYVKCEIAIEVIGLEQPRKKVHGEEGKGPFSDEQMAWVKDAVVRVFADTPFDQLKTAQGREKLRKRLAAAIEEVLGGPAVRQVLFTSFVMQ